MKSDPMLLRAAPLYKFPTLEDWWAILGSDAVFAFNPALAGAPPGPGNGPAVVWLAAGGGVQSIPDF